MQLVPLYFAPAAAGLRTWDARGVVSGAQRPWPGAGLGVPLPYPLGAPVGLCLWHATSPLGALATTLVWCGVVCRRRYHQEAKAGMSCTQENAKRVDPSTHSWTFPLLTCLGRTSQPHWEGVHALLHGCNTLGTWGAPWLGFRSAWQEQYRGAAPIHSTVDCSPPHRQVWAVQSMWCGMVWCAPRVRRTHGAPKARQTDGHTKGKVAGCPQGPASGDPVSASRIDIGTICQPPIPARAGHAESHAQFTFLTGAPTRDCRPFVMVLKGHCYE